MNVSPEPTDSAIAQPTIQTARLLLRPLALNDAAAINALLMDKEIAANTETIPFPYSELLATEWIAPQLQAWQQGRAAVFAICLPSPPANARLIGVVGLEIDSPNERAELGYWVGKSFWGNGYCTEAARATIEFGFEQLGLNRILAYHKTRNPASGRVMEKLGMTHEGVLKQHTKKWGKFEDVAVFGILRSSGRVQKK